VIGSGLEIVVDGNKCDRGREFAKHEMDNPSRTLTTTVRTRFPGVPVISVRTDGDIPRDKLMEAMKELSEVMVETELNCGDTVLENVADTGVNVIITSSALMKLGAELENKNAELKRRNAGSDRSAAAGSGTSQGIGIVVNPGALDDLGADAAGGFVGAAGEAVGVEDTFEEKADEAKSGNERPKHSGRSHIKRK